MGRFIFPLSASIGYWLLDKTFAFFFYSNKNSLFLSQPNSELVSSFRHFNISDLSFFVPLSLYCLPIHTEREKKRNKGWFFLFHWGKLETVLLYAQFQVINADEKRCWCHWLVTDWWFRGLESDKLLTLLFSHLLFMWFNVFLCINQ